MEFEERGFEKATERVEGKVKMPSGEVVSESGAQIAPATSLVVMTSQLISPPACYYCSATPLLQQR